MDLGCRHDGQLESIKTRGGLSRSLAFGRRTKAGVPLREERIEVLVEDEDAHQEQEMGATLRPLHLLLLHEALTHNGADGGFDEDSGDRLAVVPVLAEVAQGGVVRLQSVPRRGRHSLLPGRLAAASRPLGRPDVLAAGCGYRQIGLAIGDAPQPSTARHATLRPMRKKLAVLLGRMTFAPPSPAA